MTRDHSCQYPFCIAKAVQTCPKCHLWLCSGFDTPNHLDNHDCKETGAWVTGSTALNALPDLQPDDIRPDGGLRRIPGMDKTPRPKFNKEEKKKWR